MDLKLLIGLLFISSISASTESNANLNGCYRLNSLSGTNTMTASECYNINVPEGNKVVIKAISMSSSTNTCNYAHVSISSLTQEKIIICPSNLPKNSYEFLNDVTIRGYSYNTYYYDFKFTFEYNIECRNITCDTHTCIDEKQLCDGIADCLDGSDESECGNGVLSVLGVNRSRQATVSRLIKQRTAKWGWQENTPRAVVALYLSGAAMFNGTDKSEELMAKESELKAASELFRHSITNSDLGMLIHSLMVVCHNPFHFYGLDLVQKLYDQVLANPNVSHPVAYLALCNAKKTWPDKAIEDLSSLLTRTSTNPFLRDIQAMAVLAISCRENLRTNATELRNFTLVDTLNDTVSMFKTFQEKDGSFGSVHTTALIVQALLASGHETNDDWRMRDSIEFLMDELNSTSTDFLSAYLTLPILNGRTLADIAQVNCTANPRRHGDESDWKPDERIRIQVQYTLRLDEIQDEVYTLFMKVPQNYTAFKLMERAASQNSKYQFLWKTVSGQKYVYRLANIANDPEQGKLWLPFMETVMEQSDPNYLDKRLEDVILKDNDHFIMWYKTAPM